MAAADRPWSGLPAGSCVGHVHLQTGDLERAQLFYGDLLGFTVMARYSGALFWGSGGYHHQIATNLWNSQGAPRRSDLTTGLAEVEVLAADPDIVAAVTSRLAEGGLRGTPGPDGLGIADPWGTALRFALASAVRREARRSGPLAMTLTGLSATPKSGRTALRPSRSFEQTVRFLRSAHTI